MEKVLGTDFPRGIGVGNIAFIVVGLVLIYGRDIILPKGIIRVGNISYVLYLTHIYVIRLIETVIKWPEKLKFLSAIISIFIAIICASFWDVLAEQRIQKMLRKYLIYKDHD